LPHTLLRLEPHHELVVAELGINQPGELERLTEIASPDVAGLTRLGPAHVGMFGSMEALIEAKFAIFRGSPEHAVFVVNAECPYSRGAISRFGGDHRIVTFRAEGEAAADYRIENAEALASGGYRFDLHWPEGSARGLRLDAFGRHLLEDIAAAAALAGAAGYDPARVVDSLEDFRTEPMRGQLLDAGEWTLIVDCYNAAPGAMMSALRSLAELPAGRRLVLVLADMLELGEFSEALHDRLVEPLERLRPALLLSLGDQFGRLTPRLREAGIDAEHFSGREALLDALRPRLQPGDRIFLKGSRRFELERVARSLAGSIPGWEDAH
jgi:UDP-N-acetylmuramoyl-tripeptide--D-alanyl-D-alanine ligase